MHLINPKNNNKIKLVVADLKSTLLNKNRQLNNKAILMAETLRKNGIIFAITTSHSEKVAMSLVEKINPDLIILCDGAIVKYHTKTIYTATIPTKIANEIIALLIHSNKLIDLTVDTEKYFFSMRQSTGEEQKHGYSNTIMTDFIKPIEVDRILKITPRLIDVEITQEILKNYPDIYLVEFESEKGYQFKLRTATKHSALISVCDKLEISLDEIVAFGNDYTDVEMLRLVSSNGGCSVVAENAIGDCQDVADFILWEL